ncbi:MAG: hypothetical protein OHK0045_22610 [Raineya sp.]
MEKPKSYHKNPRQITEKQFNNLKQWLAELGDLSGIVHDLNSNELIGGNQRSRVMMQDKHEIVLTEIYKKPTNTGTVALGYVLWNGEKYNYRQVRWTPEQCEKANIIANKAGGTWDIDILANKFDLQSLSSWGFESWELHFANEEQDNQEEQEKNIQSNGYVIKSEIIFDNEQQKDTWLAYLKWLKRNYSDFETIAERLHIHLNTIMK